MIDPAVWRQAYQQIQAARSILILNPGDPDGDSLGASLALRLCLLSLDKTVTVFAGKLPVRYDFLSGFDALITDWADPAVRRADLVITVDFADLKQLNAPVELLAALRVKPLINIDHHGTNARFGTLNAVDPAAAATTELVYDFLETNAISYHKEVATCLMTGIITDTGNFTHLNTTDHVIEIASRLLLRGARLRAIVGRQRNKTVAQLKLWGLVLSRLRHHRRYGISITVITQSDLTDLDVTDEAADGIANFLNNLDKTKAVIVLREATNGDIKGSIRSTMPGIDVSRLARRLGGGGHKKAAGFLVRGRLAARGDTWQIR